MTNKEKLQIQELKAKGYGYGTIAKELGLSKSTVSSFCKVQDLGLTYCLMCGAKLKQTKGHRQKKYCSDKCRRNYWRIHKEDVRKNPTLECECPTCHKKFMAYKSKKAKFCSISCYLQFRYGEKGNETKHN